MSPYVICPARGVSDMEAVRQIFLEYQNAIGVDLCFQDFERELAELPGAYAPPGGELLLAHDNDGEWIGCAGLKPLGVSGIAELKRLFVRPQARGMRLGLALSREVIQLSKRLGYRELRLDSLPAMTRAHALYRQLGFQPIEPYYESPIAGTQFMSLALRTGST